MTHHIDGQVIRDIPTTASISDGGQKTGTLPGHSVTGGMRDRSRYITISAAAAALLGGAALAYAFREMTGIAAAPETKYDGSDDFSSDFTPVNLTEAKNLAKEFFSAKASNASAFIDLMNSCPRVQDLKEENAAAQPPEIEAGHEESSANPPSPSTPVPSSPPAPAQSVNAVPSSPPVASEEAPDVQRTSYSTDEAEAEVIDALCCDGYNSLIFALQLSLGLVKGGYAYETGIKAARKGVLSEWPHARHEGFKILKELAARKLYLEEITHYASMGRSDPTKFVRGLADEVYALARKA